MTVPLTLLVLLYGSYNIVYGRKKENIYFIILLSMKMYVMSTHQQCLAKALQIDTYNICFLEEVRFYIDTFYLKLFHL